MPKQESSPTQQFIDIASIENDTVVLKSGSLRRLLMISGTNFFLKSEEEQGIILYAFQGFLNSINFSVQMFIHSRKLNIDDYLKKLEGFEEQEPNPLLKNQIQEYREFIRSFVSQNAIMQKTFFAVVPFDPIQITKAGTDIAGKITGLFKSAKTAEKKIAAAEQTEGTIDKENLEQLDQRVNQAINGLNQIGLRAIPLNNEELIELFYNLYNPAAIEKRNLEIVKEEEKK